MAYIPPLAKLINVFAKLPGIGSKSAARLAFYVLRMPEAEALEMAEAITAAKKGITYCPVCKNLTDEEPCAICRNERRDRSVICVVESPKDVIAIEKTHEFSGLYHVLHGAISPMDNIGPDDIYIKELLARVTPEVKEVIAATNLTVEGEATAMYLSLSLIHIFVLSQHFKCRNINFFAFIINFGKLAHIIRFKFFVTKCKLNVCFTKNRTKSTCHPIFTSFKWFNSKFIKTLSNFIIIRVVWNAYIDIFRLYFNPVSYTHLVFPESGATLSETFMVEPYIGQKSLQNSIIAIILSFVMIIVYVWIRFRSISGLSAGLMALIALAHDVLIVFFAFVLMKIPLNDSFVAVVLTIIGYSINDTIVIYDRIRENKKYNSKQPVRELVNSSISQTLTLSLIHIFLLSFI